MLFYFVAFLCLPCLILFNLVALSFVVALPVLGRNVPTGRTLSLVFLHLS